MNTIWSHHLHGAEVEAYDAFVDTSPSGHFCQTRAWADVVCGTGYRKASFFMLRQKDRVLGTALIVRPALVGIGLSPFAWIERGPVVNQVDDLPCVLEALRHEGRKRGIFGWKVMPYWAGEQARLAASILERSGFRDTHTFGSAHASTLRLSLESPTEDLFLGKHLEKTRQKIRRAERAGASTRIAHESDWAHFQQMHTTLMQSQKMPARSERWHLALRKACTEKGQGQLFICEQEGEIVSAIVVVQHKQLATFFCGASTEKKHAYAKMILAFRDAMLWAKERGCTAFDMGGIPEEGDPDPKRHHIAQFKFDFSQERIAFVREHTRWL